MPDTSSGDLLRVNQVKVPQESDMLPKIGGQVTPETGESEKQAEQTVYYNPETAEEELSSPESIDERLRTLVRSRIAFNTPEEMQVGDAETIELLLSPSSSAEELKQQLTEAGKKEGVEGIPTTPRMQARLTGDPGFAIEAISPEVQAVSSEETTKWSWNVTPTQAGEGKELNLTISVLMQVEGETTPRRIDSYNRTIVVTEVEKSWGQRVSEFISNDWQWLWTAILVPIALAVYRTYKKRKEAKHKSHAADT